MCCWLSVSYVNYYSFLNLLLVLFHGVFDDKISILDDFGFLTVLVLHLQSITKSECPRELAPADNRSQVHCNLIRRDENCPVSIACSVHFFFHFPSPLIMNVKRGPS